MERGCRAADPGRRANPFAEEVLPLIFPSLTYQEHLALWPRAAPHRPTSAPALFWLHHAQSRLNDTQRNSTQRNTTPTLSNLTSWVQARAPFPPSTHPHTHSLSLTDTRTHSHTPHHTAARAGLPALDRPD